MSENRKHKGTHKLAFPVGVLVTILAIIGLITVVFSAVKGIDNAIARYLKCENRKSLVLKVRKVTTIAFLLN